MLITSMTTGRAGTVSQPADISIEESDLMRKIWRDAMDPEIEHDDSFITTFVIPWGSWEPWSYLNMSKSEEMRDHILKTHEGQLPMIKWAAEEAKEQAKKGHRPDVGLPRPKNNRCKAPCPHVRSSDGCGGR